VKTAIRIALLGLLAALAPAAKHVPSGSSGSSRNSVNLAAKDLDFNFPPDPANPRVHVLGHRTKWKASLGTRSYGGPIVAGGRIYTGTNNDNPRNDRDRGPATQDEPQGPRVDKGILMCFDEKTGTFLWQMVHDKLETGQANDYPEVGIASAPAVENDRVYYTSNRCEVVCLDPHGFANGNQGFQKEKYQDKTDGDVIWSYDLIKEHKVFPHNMSVCSPLIVGEFLYVVTANGVDENHAKLPAPDAPSFVCLEKKTGKLVWKCNLPGKNIMHGSWSHPSHGVFGGKPQVIFPGGDGWLYALEPATGNLIWKFDANPKDSIYELGGKGTRSDFIGMPVVHNGRIYIGTGQDPEHYDGIGHFWCIEPGGKTGDISPEVITNPDAFEPKPNANGGVVWHFGGEDDRPFTKRDILFGRTMSTAAVVGDVLYITDLAGYVHCLDARTGKRYWQWDTKSAIWGSPYYVDGKVLVANEDGDLLIFKHEDKPEVLDEVAAGSAAGSQAEKQAKAGGADEMTARSQGRRARDQAIAPVRAQVARRYLFAKVEVDEPIRSTPVVANDMLYLMTERTLYAVSLR
jgi:outer membrane protein assembly factor BamB